MLSIPISEFLALQTTWVVQPEVQYRKLCGSNLLPEFWCDFAGTPQYGKEIRFILEAKFLKGKAEKTTRRLVADFLRLSLPTNESLKRYFLLAGREEHFPESDSKILFGQELFGLVVNGGRYIRPREEVQKADFVKAFPQFQNVTEEPFIGEYA